MSFMLPSLALRQPIPFAPVSGTPANELLKQTGRVLLQAVPGGDTKAPGVDVILDLVGASHFAKNIDALSIEGRLLLVGLPSGIKAEINLAQVRYISSSGLGRPFAYARTTP